PAPAAEEQLDADYRNEDLREGQHERLEAGVLDTYIGAGGNQQGAEREPQGLAGAALQLRVGEVLDHVRHNDHGKDADVEQRTDAEHCPQDREPRHADRYHGDQNRHPGNEMEAQVLQSQAQTASQTDDNQEDH